MNEFADESMCRICYRTQDTVFSLFRKRNGISPCDKLNRIGCKADVNDAGPPSICCECLTELDVTVNFMEKCEKSNQILAEHNARRLELCKEIVNTKGDSSSLENTACCLENTVVEATEDVIEYNVNEDSKAGESRVLEETQCGECGSRRRCQHWAPPVTHTCPYCQKVFTRKFNFKLHLKRHSGSRDWSCAACGAGAVSRWLAGRHCAPRPRRACPVPGCGKTYTTGTNLNTHLRVHSGERPFECSDCGKKFTSKNTLSDHMRIHTGALPYICPICGKRFRTNKLSAHMDTHTGARHACARAGCPKRFASRLALQRHARAHAHSGAMTPGAAGGARTASPQHACALCPARYHHKQSLNKHVKKQHSQTPVNVPAEGDSAELTKEIECV